MRAFMVKLPSGDRYWTVLDDTLLPHPEIDEFLLHLRLGRDGAESTTQSYATSLALFLKWCTSIGKDWREAGPYLGRFVYWLQHHPADDSPNQHNAPIRGPRRVNAVMSAVRSFLRHAVASGALPREALTVLYETLETLRPETEFEPVLRQHRLRSRHRLSEPAATTDNASDPEVVALLTAAANARDRFIVTAMWRMGLRRGELLGLRRSDVHFLPNSTQLGCKVRGAHVHVIRRANPNLATAKSRRHRAVPADWLTVQAYDQYVAERALRDPAQQSDLVIVNLFSPPVGAPMRPAGVNELLARLSGRAALTRTVRPHMLRHSFATGIAAAGGTADELRELLGHAWISSSQVYLHPSPDRLRAAVDRVPSPRADAATQASEIDP